MSNLFKIERLKKNIQNYWFPLFISIATFVVYVYTIKTNQFGKVDSAVFRVLSILALGISISLAVELMEFLSSKTRSYWRVAACLFIAIQMALVAQMESFRNYLYIYLNLTLLSHLLVSLSFWFSKGRDKLSNLTDSQRLAEDQMFWNQNWRVLSNFISSVLVNLILFLGLFLGLYSLNFLFDYKASESVYTYVFGFSAILGITYCFISLQFSSKENTEASKVLAPLVKFVFPFLQGLYFCILYGYLTKIIFSWSLPRGSIGYLVSGLCVLICLSHLIIKPFQNKTAIPQLTNLIWRFSFALLLPLLSLLLVSICRRLFDYGFTENRTILLILNLWMFYVAITHFRPQKTSMHQIPLSLFVITLLTSFGPLSPYSISYWSQKKILFDQLRPIEGRLVGTELKIEKKVETKKQIQLIRQLQTLCQTYGVKELYTMLGGKLEISEPRWKGEYCYYQPGNNVLSESPFGKLIESTNFNVIHKKNIFYQNYNLDDELEEDAPEVFEFSIDANVSHTQMNKHQMAFVYFNNYEKSEVGGGLVQFKKTHADKVAWHPSKGPSKTIDLRPLMEKLSKKPKSYRLADHPEDHMIEVDNGAVRLTIKIQRLQFNTQVGLYIIENMHWTTIAYEK